GVCGVTDASSGASCSDSGGTVCNATGSCVACNTTADCHGSGVCDTTSNTCVQCNAPSDCAAQGTTCKTNTCTGNKCGTSNAGQGIGCSDGHGDTVCDGNGACVACNAPSDCPVQASACQEIGRAHV